MPDFLTRLVVSVCAFALAWLFLTAQILLPFPQPYYDPAWLTAFYLLGHFILLVLIFGSLYTAIGSWFFGLEKNEEDS